MHICELLRCSVIGDLFFILEWKSRYTVNIISLLSVINLD